MLEYKVDPHANYLLGRLVKEAIEYGELRVTERGIYLRSSLSMANVDVQYTLRELRQHLGIMP